ncbi:LPS export ABC transporter periplasmic protein LptC [Gallibacterium genomosp. 3]|uniref:Lipopolysaccharide export system protein LptC n=1 Tax=Gallibacterium genomosp. 3 TaxID=505345 RepID=A0A1A7PU92_9PAST|nr:LPS export ABC transporter periplasmic protein LptC [Gallibacterium genomosp. 3]OBX05619.1 sugar transporter [Gallibacterium genomosp. 3]
MSIRWNIVLSIIALALLAWLYSLQQTTVPVLTKKASDPEYIAKQMTTIVYGPTGTIQYQAESDNVDYFNDDKAIFTHPILYVYDENEVKTWRLQADKAILQDKDQLTLQGNVKLQSLQKESKLQTIDTEQAFVNLTTQDITSDTMVTLTGLNFTSNGKVLDGNLQKQTATLKEQVKTYYEIKN